MPRPPAVAVLLLLAATAAFAESEGVRLKARLDWAENGATTKASRWHPVVVTLENQTGRDLQGTVWVEVEQRGTQVYDHHYQRPIQLASGAKKRFSIEIWLGGEETSVYVGSEFETHKALVGLPVNFIGDTCDTILVAGKMPKVLLSRIERRNSAMNPVEYFPERVVYSVGAEDIPGSWRGLDGVEGLVWTDEGVGDLSAQQTQAIVDWVRMGGNLVLTGGDAAASTYGSPLAAILPGTCAGRTEVNVPEALAQTIGFAKPAGAKPILAAKLTSIEAPVWATAEGVPLLLERRVGLGRVCVVPFDLLSEQATTAKGFDLLLEHLVDFRCFSAFRAPAPPDEQRQSSYGRWGPPAKSDVDFETSIVDSFRKSAYRVPPVAKIAVYLGAYFAACLLNLLAWRGAHRREYAWVSLLVLSVGFATYAYGNASMNAKAAPSVRHVKVVELGPDGAAGREIRYCGFFTTVSQTVDIATLDAREALTLVGRKHGSAIGESPIAIIEDGGPARIPELSILPRDVTCLRTEKPSEVEPGIAAHTAAHEGQIEVTVSRPSRGTPIAPILSFGSGAVRMSEATSSGAFRGRLTPLPTAFRAQLFDKLYKELSDAKVPEEAIAAIRSSIAPISRDGDPAYVVLPVLDEPSSLRFAGREIEIDLGLTLYILPIRWDGCLAGVVDVAPFCRRRMCASDGDNPVRSLTPLWEGAPTPTRFDRTVSLPQWIWRRGEWTEGTNRLAEGALNPFGRELRYRMEPGSRYDPPCPLPILLHD